jgi:signal transduction histidine kinase
MAERFASADGPPVRRLVTRPLLFDAAIAGTVLALTLTAAHSVDGLREFDARGVALAVLGSAPLLARRVAPLAVFALTAVAGAALLALGYLDATAPGIIVALFFVAYRHDVEDARAWLTDVTVIACFLLHVAAFFAQQQAGYPGVPPIPFGALFWIGAWVVGARAREWRERKNRERRIAIDAQRDRRLAVAEERARIARDLHDSAGHAINVILVQAGAARMLQQRDPQAARAALETIEEVARETIGEIDQLVRHLRDDAPDEPPEEVEPPAGLATLEALADRHRASGMRVTTTIHGPRRTLAPALDRAAYRILQEALTNASRHGRDRVLVGIMFGTEALELTVTNPVGDGGGAGDDGNGIIGMRERAALLGGTLEAGPRDDCFGVHARLPYDGAPA